MSPYRHLEGKESLPTGPLDTLLWRFTLRGTRLDLVCDWPERAPGSSRTFARLSFEGVQGYKRSHGNRRLMNEYYDSYLPNREGATYLVQRISAKSSQCEIDFGTSLGRIDLKCDRVSVLVLDTVASQTGPERWSYRNLRTGAAVDLNHLFEDPS